jgi:hypothetical protein
MPFYMRFIVDRHHVEIANGNSNQEIGTNYQEERNEHYLEMQALIGKDFARGTYNQYIEDI